MRKILRISAPAIALILLVGCAPFSSIKRNEPPKSSIDGHWAVLNNGQSKIENLPRPPVVVFDTRNHSVYGFDGCNEFRGNYVLEGGQIKARLATTRMACFGETPQAVSTTLHRLFDQGAEIVEVSPKTLLIRNKTMGAELRLGSTEPLTQKQ